MTQRYECCIFLLHLPRTISWCTRWSCILHTSEKTPLLYLRVQCFVTCNQSFSWYLIFTVRECTCTFVAMDKIQLSHAKSVWMLRDKQLAVTVLAEVSHCSLGEKRWNCILIWLPVGQRGNRAAAPKPATAMWADTIPIVVRGELQDEQNDDVVSERTYITMLLCCII